MRILRIILLTMLCCALSASMRAKPSLFFSYAQFSLENGTPYTEFYLRVPASGLKYHKAGIEKWQLSAGIQIIIRKDTAIVYADRYLLKGPEKEDTTGNPYDIIDLKRIKLDTGNYTVELSVTDAGDVNTESKLNMSFLINRPVDDFYFSNIMLLDSFYPGEDDERFARMGYELIPAVTGFVDTKKEKLFYYAELYAKKKSVYGKAVRIEALVLDSAGNMIANYSRVRTKNLSPLVPVIDVCNLKDLPEGNYTLQLNAYDTAGILLCSSSEYFTKASEKKINAEQMFQYVPVAYIRAFSEYMTPIAEQNEMDILSALNQKGDTMGIKRWFFRFWQDRNYDNPMYAYMQYILLVQSVESLFATKFVKGYKTDRGRVFMKYGPPNNVTSSQDEPEAYPYEIWQYYRAGNQTDVKFVFYNPTQVDKDFVLLHSTMRGEVNNPQWKKMIYQRTNTNTRLDQDGVPKDYGNKLEERIKE